MVAQNMVAYPGQGGALPRNQDISAKQIEMCVLEYSTRTRVQATTALTCHASKNEIMFK